MFGLGRQKREVEQMKGFIAQIRETNTLKSQSNELYRFAIDACQEIYKYTGEHDWHKRLESITIDKTIK